MMILRPVKGRHPAHVFIVCEICHVEVDIVGVLRYEELCGKKGWTKKKEYDGNAPVGERYKLFHFCPECSVGHKNK